MRRDPFATSVALLVALVIIGLGVVGLAWRGLAGHLVIALQLPWAVSGAIGGLGVVGGALGLAAVQAGRRDRAGELADLERLTDAAARVLAAARGRDAS